MEYEEKHKEKKMYQKFALMLLISFCIMYLVMFLNVSEAGHIYLSTTRLYMSLLMVAPMAIVMMLMMGKMYPNKSWNRMIMFGSMVVFIGILVMLRTQTPIGDRQYMKAMIPHHSSAILTSQEAALKDPEVIKLSQEIIKAQEEEIAQMKAILDRLE